MVRGVEADLHRAGWSLEPPPPGRRQREPTMVPSVAVVAALCAARVGAESTLPSAAFLVRSASWGFTEGEVPQEEVLEQITGNTECESFRINSRPTSLRLLCSNR